MQKTNPKSASIDQVFFEIQRAERLLIIISGPDLDSVGSGIVLKNILTKSFNKSNPSPRLICNSQLGSLSELPHSEEITIADPAGENFNNYSLIITLDTANPYPQLVDRKIHSDFRFPESACVLSIDHHLGNEGFATYNIYDPNVSSTCELIYNKFVERRHYNLDRNEATLLLAGVSGDTGHFRWNTTAETFRISRDLAKLGADITWIVNFLFFNNTQFDLEFTNYCLSKIEYFEDEGCTFVEVDSASFPKQSFLEIKSGRNLFSSVFARSVSRYPISIFVLIEGNLTHINLLGNNKTNEIDLTKLSLLAGGNGGGHFQASGFTTTQKPQVVKTKLLEVLRKLRSNEVN